MTDILEQRVEEIRLLNSNFKPGREQRVSQVIEKLFDINIQYIKTSY